jgi:RimJ/RimL family protein N-acetyltransferase
MTTLIEAADAHFAWMLGEATRPDGLELPEGGVESPGVLRWLRRGIADAATPSCWLIVADSEVVGLCSFKGAPDADGYAEIGYGVAAERRRRGHATAAVACLVEQVRSRSGLAGLTAETAVENVASGRVLEANGFSRTGARTDPEEGEMIVWRRAF